MIDDLPPKRLSFEWAIGLAAFGLYLIAIAIVVFWRKEWPIFAPAQLDFIAAFLGPALAGSAAAALGVALLAGSAMRFWGKG